MGSRSTLTKITFILFFAVSGLLFLSYLTAGLRTRSQCQKEVFRAHISLIPCPGGKWLEDVSISRDQNEIVVRLYSEIKELYVYRTTNFFALDEYLPGGKYKRTNLSLDEALKIFNSWANSEKTQAGIFLKKYQEYFEPYAKAEYRPSDDFGSHFEKKEIWKYQVKEKNWQKLDWETGLKMIEEGQFLQPAGLAGQKRALVTENTVFFDGRKLAPSFRYGIHQNDLSGGPDVLVAPDVSKIVYRPYLRKAGSNFIQRMIRGSGSKEGFLMGLGISCVLEKVNKVLKMVPENHKINFQKALWSADGSFLVIPQSRFENEETPDRLAILYFK